MGKINKEQSKTIREHFNAFLASENFSKNLEERDKHREETVSIIEEKNLRNLSEIDFGKLISKLWASNTWGNKDYLVQKIINDNGIEKIKRELYNLLYGKEQIEKRYDSFRKEIKGLGPSSITEILCLFDPTKYCIWNFRAKRGIEKLKLDSLPINRYSITGREYKEIIEGFSEIAEEIKKLGYSKIDFLLVDGFLYYVNLLKAGEIQLPTLQNFSHNEIRDYIKDIGDWLGFETEIEKKIARGAIVDVVWSARIANLGVVTYVFEVQKGGSVDSLVINLQKALNNATVQKIIAVSNSEQIERIKKEVEDIWSDNFRRALTYWNVDEVVKTHENLSEAIESINKLELVKSQFSGE